MWVCTLTTDSSIQLLKKTSNQDFQALWVTIHFTNKRDIICGVIYRQHNCPDKFLNYFDETLERLSNSSKSIYVMTDANINLLRYETCKYAQSFLHILQSLCFSPTIDKPTRVHNASATLIDNIFVNNYDAHILSGNIVSDVSDHFSQFCVCRPLGGKIKLQKIVTRDFSKFSEEKFINDLSLLNWESAVSESTNDVNKSFSTFYNKLNRIVNKHAPIKTISKRKAKQLNKPWITKRYVQKCTQQQKWQKREHNGEFGKYGKNDNFARIANMAKHKAMRGP